MQGENDFIEDDYDDEDENTQKDKYLSFFIGKEEYCVGVACVIEVIGMQKITHVPEMPDFLKGVINLRGQVIPVTDIRVRFGMDSLLYNDRTCIIVVDVRDSHVGLVVDSVNDVLDIPGEQVEAPPSVNRHYGNRFITGLGKIGEDVKIILDIQKLLFDDEDTSLDNR
ncbi:MAG: chemotaxis protein CheW [Proteobacteria bacterium]|nr:chemotaxis protein CheW [Pseudomonadota bacterium]